MRGWSRLSCVLPMLVLGVACGPSRVAWQPRTTPGQGALVVLGASAPIRTRPDVRAPLVPLDPRASRPPGVPESVYSFRLLRSRSGWAELETLDELASTCAPPPTALAPFRLLLYVREESLRPVTRMEVERRFPDGTSVFLARGVPVEQLGGSSHRAQFGLLSLPITLRADSIGTRFLPSRFDDGAGAGWLSPRALAANAVGLGGARVEAAHDMAIAVHSVTPVGDRLHAVVRTRCGEVTLETPEDGVHPTPPLRVSGREEPSAWVRRGAAARWPDGRDAGEVRSDTGLGQPAAEEGCYAVLGRRAIVLCFDPADITAGPPPVRGLAGALATP